MRGRCSDYVLSAWVSTGHGHGPVSRGLARAATTMRPMRSVSVRAPSRPRALAPSRRQPIIGAPLVVQGRVGPFVRHLDEAVGQHLPERPVEGGWSHGRCVRIGRDRAQDRIAVAVAVAEGE